MMDNILKNIKIAFFLDYTGKYFGGATNTILNQAILMNKLYNIIVVIPKNQDGIYSDISLERCKQNDMKYVLLEFTSFCRLRDLDYMKSEEEVQGIEDFLQKNNITLIHYAQLSIAVEMAARRLNIPTVMNVYSIEEWELKLPVKDIYAQFVTSDSDMWCSVWKNYIGSTVTCIRVYANKSIQHRMIDKKRITIGIIGCICEYKNQLTAIKAIENFSNIELYVVGTDNSKYAEKCKKYVKNNGLHKRVFFCGFCEKIEDILAKLDVVLCASKRESFPSSIVEAMSAQIPIISTPVAGIPEILNNRNAYITDGYEVNDLRNSIARFLADVESGYIDTIKSNEKETYENTFSDNIVSQQLVELYLQVLRLYDCNKTGLIGIENLINNVKYWCNKLKLVNLCNEDFKAIAARLGYYIEIASQINGKRCYIWGAGKWGNRAKTILDLLCPETEMIAYIDKNRRQELNGYAVIKPDSIRMDEIDCILLAYVGDKKDTIEFLKNKKFILMEQIFIIV